MANFTSWRRHGTSDFGPWTPGEAVTDIGTLKPGDVLFVDSAQFDALNLATVLRPATELRPATLRMVNPLDTSQTRLFADPEGFAQWGGKAWLTNHDGTPVLRRAERVCETTE